MRDYEELQKEDSAWSRGTSYGVRAVENVQKVAPFLKGRVLNIGCGDGLETQEIQKYCDEVMGLDIHPDKVRVAHQNGIIAMIGRMEDLPFKDDWFDVVYCAHTLEHAEDLELAVNEITRVGKRAVIIVPIEKYGTTNESHTSLIESTDQMRELFGEFIWENGPDEEDIEQQFYFVYDKY